MLRKTAAALVIFFATAAFAMPLNAAESDATAVSTAVPASKPDTSGSKKSKDVHFEQLEKESSTLPPEKSKLYNETMKKAIEDSFDARKQIRKAYEEADALLTAEKFDKAAFLAKAAEIDDRYNKSRAKLNEAFASAINGFTQEERKEVLKARNENRRQRP